MVSSSNAINNTVGASISGVTNTLTVTNGSNTASSAARETITVGGGTAGDPSLNFNVSGVTDWEIGIDNSSSDSLKISQGTTIGTNDTWIMTIAGERTMPLQPAFCANLSSNVLNVTGDGTTYKIICDNETLDQNNDYDPVTGIFTAPVSGNYYFTGSCALGNLNASHTALRQFFLATSEYNEVFQLSAAAIRNYATNLTLSCSTFMKLTAGQTVTFEITVGNGTKTVNVLGSGSLTTTPYCYFKGFLVC